MRVLTAPASECNSIWSVNCACRRHQGCHSRKRRLRYVADFWAALGQAAACLYLVRWGVGRKAQWRVEKLSAEHLLAVRTWPASRRDVAAERRKPRVQSSRCGRLG